MQANGTLSKSPQYAIEKYEEKPRVKSPRPGTSSSVGRKLDEIFEVSELFVIVFVFMKAAE